MRLGLPDKEFIKIWQTSETMAEMVKKMKLPSHPSSTQRIRQAATALRGMGVPLKKIRQRNFEDWDKLAEYAQSFLKKTK